ncbi:MAG: leucine-rich repeat protein [Spirochaetales bacterium]|nr:leucine-rich repeat protein [Spirochaetales bacterium]
MLLKKILISLIFPLLLFSCNMGDSAEESTTTVNDDGSLTIVLSLSSIDTDSVTYSVDGLASCELTGSTDGSSYEELASWTVDDVFDFMAFTLDPGTWSFLFTAYDAEGTALMEIALADQTISASGYLSFDLPQLETGTGSLEYTLSWPSSEGIVSAEVSLDGADGESLTILSGTDYDSVCYTKEDADAGDRALSFSLSFDGETGYYSDEILVLDSLKGSTSVTLTDYDGYSAPAAPSDVAAASVENLTDEDTGTVGLSWTDNSSLESSYEIQYSEDGVTWSDLDSADEDSTAYAASSDRGSSPTYRVRAVNSTGNSDWVSSGTVDVPYLVSFEETSGIILDNQEVLSGGLVTEPDFSDYCTVSQWYSDSDLSVEWDLDSDAVTESMTLYGEGTWEPYGDFSYTISGGEVTITNYSGSDTDVEIPDEIFGYPVRVLESGDYSSIFENSDTLVSVALPEGLTEIGDHAFSSCSSLDSLTLPEGLTEIGTSAFQGCKSLASIDFPESLTTLGYASFCNCSSLESVVLPDNLTSFADNVFHECFSLTSVSLPDGITELGSCVFMNCTSLTTFTLPDTLSSIGNACFLNCTSLSTVICEAAAPPTLGGDYVFDGNADGRIIYVPADSVDSYQAADYWSEYADDIEAIVE